MRKFRNCMILFILILPIFMNAQVTVKLRRPPLNQLRVENLWWVDLNNTTQATYSIYLHAEITGTRKGPLFRANSNSFTLSPGMKRIRPKDISEVRNVWYHSKYKEFIVKTGGIPDGSYNVCIYVMDSKTNQEIGKQCIQVVVRLPGSPKLISPKNGEEVGEKRPLFKWIPSIRAGKNVRYKLKIVEVLKGQTAAEAMQFNKPLYDGKISRYYFIYPLSMRALERGKEYAWQIYTFMDGAEINASAVWQFDIGVTPPPRPVTPSIIVVSPNGGESLIPGNIFKIKWIFLGISAEEIIGDVSIDLYKSGSFHSNITLEASPGVADSGSYEWDIPLFQPYGNDYRVMLKASREIETDPFFIEMIDESDSLFTIKTAGKIAFVSCEHDEITNSDIYVLDEGGKHRLTTNIWNDKSPSWSSSWRKIAFASNRDTGDFNIYVMNTDGTDKRRLTDDPSDDNEPAWSPDGNKIAFCSNRDGNREIYVMNSSGMNIIRLTNHSEVDQNPAWSPDGSQIAFSSNRDGNGEIYVMNADGTNLQRLTGNPEFDLEPAWSPDGSQITFSSMRDGDYNIYIMNTDGTDKTRLTLNPAEDRHPSWSYDGSKIAFYSKRTGYYDLYVMNADGSKKVNITESDIIFDWEPAWTPSGFMMIEHDIFDVPITPPVGP